MSGTRPAGLAATITPHHLMLNRNALFQAGCVRTCTACRSPSGRRTGWPCARPRPRAIRGFSWAPISAPHPRADKETDCGCAGIFNAPNALECVAQVFDEDGALEMLETFVSISGAAFHGKPPNSDSIVLEKAVGSGRSLDTVSLGRDVVRVFAPPTPPRWRIAAGLR